MKHKATDSRESDITINGKTINIAQATTLRVAVTSFIYHLHYDGLGNDEHGKSMTKLYLKSAREVEKMLTE